MSISRRSFIRYASLAAAGNAAGLHPFGALNGLAATSPTYKALVCIFLYGGNDSNNMLVPYNTSANGSNGHSAYAAIRGPLALSAGSLLPLDGKVNGNYGVHPSLSGIPTLFNNGNLAFVANVGTLLQPLSRTQFLANDIPTPNNLFSHPDQQLEWQNASATAGSSIGWAGRIADTMTSSYNSNADIPLIASVYGDPVFCNGAKSSPVAVSAGSVGAVECSEGSACTSRTDAAQHLLTFKSGFSLVEADNEIASNSYKYMSILGDAVQSVAPLTTGFPNTSLGAQMKQIAQIMQVRSALGVKRQIFFAGLGNFDTHGNQLPTQASLLSQLGPAMYSFYKATQALGISDQVTSFTMSDFSRALQPNSNDGSDHAWGGHHMVMGGAVNGGKIYGSYPTLKLRGPNDSGSNGRWIPTLSSSQYAATLAAWFGVSSTDLHAIFPSLKNFGATNLGFV